jgi:hypothetical protein
MDDVVLTRTLCSQGFDERDLQRMRRDSSLVPVRLPVRRGAYVRERPAERTLADEHRELIFATAPQLRRTAGYLAGTDGARPYCSDDFIAVRP